MYVQYNPNPVGKLIGDCVVRAICKVTGKTWTEVYLAVCNKGLELHDMPSANYVWASYLYDLGFHKYIIPDSCPDCYTVRHFCKEHQYGKFILGTGTHVIAVVDGNYFDSWNSGDEVPIYYFER